MCNLFGVMVFQRSIVNWHGGKDVSSVYVHSAICDTYVVQWYSIHLLSIGMGVYICSVYVHSAIYVKLIWCNGISEIYCQLEWG